MLFNFGKPWNLLLIKDLNLWLTLQIISTWLFESLRVATLVQFRRGSANPCPKTDLHNHHYQQNKTYPTDYNSEALTNMSLRAHINIQTKNWMKWQYFPDSNAKLPQFSKIYAYKSHKFGISFLEVPLHHIPRKVGRVRVNPLLHKYSFWRMKNRQFLKTLWEKEKLLVTSNFSFSHVFYSNQIIVSPFVNIFDIVSLFAAEFEEPKVGISGKGIMNVMLSLCHTVWSINNP